MTTDAGLLGGAPAGAGGPDIPTAPPPRPIPVLDLVTACVPIEGEPLG